MKRRFDGWAPPARVWRPWVKITDQFGGPLSFKVNFDTISDAPSSFDAEIKYWRGNDSITDIAVGPGSHTFLSGICVCVSQIRFRSHTFGQVIKISIEP